MRDFAFCFGSALAVLVQCFYGRLGSMRAPKWNPDVLFSGSAS